MPNISVYLNDETLKLISAKSKTDGLPVSTIIREAVEQYLDIVESRNARDRILKTLTSKHPLGEWEDLHEERTSADANRG